MTGLERSLRFVRGDAVDRPPCHPMLMRWAARYAGVPYRAFCLEPEAKCGAALACAEDFDLDWVTVMSDPWAEAEAFGLQVDYPEDGLPVDTGGHLADPDALRPYRVEAHARLRGRMRELETYARDAGSRYLVVGWVEGPMAAYANLRGASRAAMDLLDQPEAVHRAMEVIVEAALPFITAQVEAGAHCIGIGDAFASQIGPGLYRTFVQEREQRLVGHIHRLGALAKLHICGNTQAILPALTATGADIVDVDHLVPAMDGFAGHLGAAQVFCGKSNPVAVLQNGTPQEIIDRVREDFEQAGGRCIVSAGCEIPPGTPPGNLRALRAAAGALGTG